MIDAADIEAIAQRTAELLREQQHTHTDAPWISVDEKARQLGVPTSLIYRHATDVGGVKIGDRWRFPPEPPAAPPATPQAPPRQRKRTSTVPLLPIHG
jgi:hypothetical protein